MSTITVSNVPFAMGDGLVTLPLFAHLGLDSPGLESGDRSKACVPVHCHLKLVWSKPSPVFGHDTQLELDFGRTNIVDFVPSYADAIWIIRYATLLKRSQSSTMPPASCLKRIALRGRSAGRTTRGFAQSHRPGRRRDRLTRKFASAGRAPP